MHSRDELFQRSREVYFGVYNKHQNKPLVSAETVRHESAYVVLYFPDGSGSIPLSFCTDAPDLYKHFQSFVTPEKSRPEKPRGHAVNGWKSKDVRSPLDRPDTREPRPAFIHALSLDESVSPSPSTGSSTGAFVWSGIMAVVPVIDSMVSPSELYHDPSQQPSSPNQELCHTYREAPPDGNCQPTTPTPSCPTPPQYPPRHNPPLRGPRLRGHKETENIRKHRSKDMSLSSVPPDVSFAESESSDDGQHESVDSSSHDPLPYDSTNDLSQNESDNSIPDNTFVMEDEVPGQHPDGYSLAQQVSPGEESDELYINWSSLRQLLYQNIIFYTRSLQDLSTKGTSDSDTLLVSCREQDQSFQPSTHSHYGKLTRSVSHNDFTTCPAPPTSLPPDIDDTLPPPPVHRFPGASMKRKSSLSHYYNNYYNIPRPKTTLDRHELRKHDQNWIKQSYKKWRSGQEIVPRGRPETPTPSAPE